MASQYTTEIQRAAAAMREEAALVLRRAVMASRLGADLSLAVPESPVRTSEERMATLPEPEGEPLLSLTSAASLQCCGYIMEDEEGEVSTQKDVDRPYRTAESETTEASQPRPVSESDGGESLGCSKRSGQEVHVSDGPGSSTDSQAEAEEEDVRDEADLAEWIVEREAAEELLRPIVRSLFGEGAHGGLPLEVQGEPLPEAVACEAAARARPEALATTLEDVPSAGGVAPQAREEPPLQERAASPREAFAVLAPASTYEDLVEAAQQRQEQQRKARVAAFLKENGYVDAQAPKRTLLKTKFPLHTAAKQGDAAMVQLLLEQGADPTRKTSWGKTAAQIAKAKDRGGSHSAVLRALGGA